MLFFSRQVRLLSCVLPFCCPAFALACGGFWDTGCNLGKVVEKAGRDTGKTVEKAAHDTGKALEKAGQDTGKGVAHLFKELTKFKPSCAVPEKEPDTLGTPYQSSCSYEFSRYRTHVEVCNGAGGTSWIAAAAGPAVAGVTIAGAAVSGGGTYALAKAAYELCEKACASQARLKLCVAKVDAAAVVLASEAKAATEMNDTLEAGARLLPCVEDGYSGEVRLRMMSILAECEAEKSCNTRSPTFSKHFNDEVKRQNDQTEARRDAARESLRKGTKSPLDYGPTLRDDRLKSLVLQSSADANPDPVCWSGGSRVTLHIEANPTSPVSLRVRWLRDGKVEMEEPTDLATGNAEVPVDLAGKGAGKWTAQVKTESDQLLGEWNFIYLPKPAAG